MLAVSVLIQLLEFSYMDCWCVRMETQRRIWRMEGRINPPIVIAALPWWYSSWYCVASVHVAAAAPENTCCGRWNDPREHLVGCSHSFYWGGWTVGRAIQTAEHGATSPWLMQSPTDIFYAHRKTRAQKNIVNAHLDRTYKWMDSVLR